MTPHDGHQGEWEAGDLCIGCRAATDAPRTLSDQFPLGSPPPAMGWERFTCARRGVLDVRLVTVPTGSSNASQEAET